MPNFDAIAALPLFDNSPLAWLGAVTVTVGLLLALFVVRRVVRAYHRRFEASERVLLKIPLDVLSRTSALFFLVIATFIGLNTLTLGNAATRVLSSAVTIALFWQAGVWAAATASAWLEHKRLHGASEDRAIVGSLGIIGFIVNGMIWSFVLLLTLDNLGVDITALVAGLGIGGIAVALAVQNIFGDLFASLSIALDRPFVVGDFLIVDDILGSVESVGIKSTRLRSLSGEQIIVPNADLLGSRVRNYGRMAERRVVFATSIARETPIDLVEKIPALIREIVESQEDTRFDRSHFAKHGAASLDFETVYYVRSPDYTRYMDVQQAINLRLHRELSKRRVDFAYPVQKLLVSGAAVEAA